MKITKQSNFTGFTPTKTATTYRSTEGAMIGRRIVPQQEESKVESYAQAADKDLENLFLLVKGRIRFGDGGDGDRGENMAGEFQVFAPSSTGNTTITHTLGSTPIGYIVVKKTGYGDIYFSSANTANIVFVSSTTGLTYTVFLLK